MKYTEEEINLIAVSSFEELTYGARLGVLKALGALPKNLADNLLIKSPDNGVYNKVREKFSSQEYRKTLLDGLERRKVDCITVLSPDYPEQLKHIHDPPLVLYAMGNKGLLSTRLFSIVGSRRTSANMLSECKKFSAEIARHFTVVSGSAYGADSAALAGASGRAISVIAYGFDYIPKAPNAKLLDDVRGNGLLLSEYHPSFKPQKFYFPVRNRIIAALSEGVLIVSGGTKSGTLITAGFATEYGREVFAFPYGIGASSGEGCNNLIKEGANICCNPLDILEVFGLDLKPQEEATLSEEERKVFDLIKEHGEAFVPAIANSLGVPPYKLIPVLSALEIKKLVVRLGGNRYGVI